MKHFQRVEPTKVMSAGGQFKRKLVVKRYKTEDGLEHEFTTFGAEGSRSGAVIALTKDRKVITMYQFRAGPERWMHDIPGGGIYEGEDPMVGVMRELREEAGYTSKHVEYLGESCRDAYINGTWHYYLATNCEAHPKGRQLDVEEVEQGAEMKLISIKELIDNALHGEMTDPAAVLMAYEKLKILQEA
jgi:8-oxo-dGTP pyrophosphatase MutT (NUDIX family)